MTGKGFDTGMGVLFLILLLWGLLQSAGIAALSQEAESLGKEGAQILLEQAALAEQVTYYNELVV